MLVGVFPVSFFSNFPDEPNFAVFLLRFVFEESSNYLGELKSVAIATYIIAHLLNNY